MKNPIYFIHLVTALTCFLRATLASKIVEYDFRIGYFIASPDGYPVNVLGVNDQLPSPTIEVTKGDTLIVNVFNNDPAHSHSLHWHGLSQKGSAEMDGVVGVTQCGLPPFKSMTYRFVIMDDPGTYWYHGHSGLNKIGVRGIGGLLIVKAPEGEDVHHELYSDDKELFLQDWSHESPHDHYMKALGGLHPPVAQSANRHNIAMFPWTTGLINGVGNHDGMYSIVQLNHFSSSEEDDIKPDQFKNGARLRIANGGENFAFKISVDCHHLLIISTDGTDTEPKLVDSVIVHLGERYDAVIVPRKQSPEDLKCHTGNYWIRAETLEKDQGAQVPTNHGMLAVLRYAGALEVLPETKPYPAEKEVVLNCFDFNTGPTHQRNSNCLPVTALRTHSSILHRYDALIHEEPDETHEIAFEHSRGSKHFGHFTRVQSNTNNNMRPSKMSHREGAFTQFVLPSRPKTNATGDTNHKHTVSLDLTHENRVQLIWNHQARTAHPIHIHGYKFIVAATHEADVFKRCTVVDCPDEQDWFTWPLDKKVVDNTIHQGYVVKDTAVLPAGGYLVTRFVADNPGEWLAHCHTDFHLEDGMGLILREKKPGDEHFFVKSPPDFPKCQGAEYEAFDLGATASRQLGCECLHDPETILHASPEAGWRCSKDHLCRHQAIVSDDTERASQVATEQKGSSNIRGIRTERNMQKVGTTIAFSVIVGLGLLFVILWWNPTDALSEESSPIGNLIRLIFYDEWIKRMTSIALFQVIGLALVGGILYFNAGFNTDERVFREKLALIFWMCAFWSVGTIYSSIVTYYSDLWSTSTGGRMIYQKTKAENMEVISHFQSSRTLQINNLGAPAPAHGKFSSDVPQLSSDQGKENDDMNVDQLECRILAYHGVRWAIGILLAIPFPFLFSAILDSFTQMSPSTGAVFAIGFILLLTQQAFDALGRLLAEIAGRKSIGRAVCLGTIISQLLVVGGGFYRTVHPAISMIGPILYSFSAISKLLFSADDSFWCTPDRADAWLGYTWCPLELSGAVEDLKFRGLNIINLYETPSVWKDIWSLVTIIVVLRVGCYGVANWKAQRKENRKGALSREKGVEKTEGTNCFDQTEHVNCVDDHGYGDDSGSSTGNDSDNVSGGDSSTAAFNSNNDIGRESHCFTLEP